MKDRPEWPSDFDRKKAINSNKTNKERLSSHLKKRGIDPYDKREDLPCRLYRNDIAPIRSSVHISIGKTISRSLINKLFKKVRDSKTIIDWCMFAACLLLAASLMAGLIVYVIEALKV
jgi:hypothetical protein